MDLKIAYFFHYTAIGWIRQLPTPFVLPSTYLFNKYDWLGTLSPRIIIAKMGTALHIIPAVRLAEFSIAILYLNLSFGRISYWSQYYIHLNQYSYQLVCCE